MRHAISRRRKHLRTSNPIESAFAAPYALPVLYFYTNLEAASLAAVPFNAFAELMAIAVTFVAFVTQMFAALMMLTGFTLLPFTVILTAFLVVAILSPIFFVDLNDIIWRSYSSSRYLKSRCWRAG